MIRYRSNPRKHPAIITVDGKEYVAKYIGRGQYSKVYRVGDRVVYFTRGDCGKEVLAQFQYHRMVHLPELIRHENMTTVRGTWYVFSSPYYRNVTTKDRSAYTLMKKIVELYADFSSAVHGGVLEGEKLRDIYAMQGFVEYIKGTVLRSVVKALQEIVYVASNCGEHVNFDLHKKNFGVNEYGTLIFRDPIYVRE